MQFHQAIPQRRFNPNPIQNYAQHQPMRQTLIMPQQQPRSISPFRVYKNAPDHNDYPIIYVRPQVNNLNSQQAVPIKPSTTPKSNNIIKTGIQQKNNDEVNIRSVKTIITELLSKKGNQVEFGNTTVGMITAFIVEECKSKNFLPSNMMEIYESITSLNRALLVILDGLRDKLNIMIQQNLNVERASLNNFKQSFSDLSSLINSSPPRKIEQDTPVLKSIQIQSDIKQTSDFQSFAAGIKEEENEDDGLDIEYLKIIETARYYAEAYLENLSKQAVMLNQAAEKYYDD